MLEKVGTPSTPKGLKLKLFKLPVYLYHFKLGFLLGDRFICLKHWGRKSGQLRKTVVEVVYWDKKSGKLYIASGYGVRSQWFKNIIINKNVLLTVKNKDYEAKTRILDESESEEILLRYSVAHPRSLRSVARLSGYRMTGTKEDVIEFSRIIKVIELSLK